LGFIFEVRYTISIREVHVSHRQVEAGSIDEAISKATNGDYELELLEYSHTLDNSQIDVYDTETKLLITGGTFVGRVEDNKLG
jgi:hypothetical protein